VNLEILLFQRACQSARLARGASHGWHRGASKPRITLRLGTSSCCGSCRAMPLLSKAQCRRNCNTRVVRIAAAST